MCSDSWLAALVLLVLHQCLGRPLHSLLEGRLVRQVVANLLRAVGVEDHADNAAGPRIVILSHPRVQVLAQELLLSVSCADIGDLFRCDACGRRLLLGGAGHGHLWHWHLRQCCGLGWLLLLRGTASKRGEATLVDGDALLGRLLVTAWVLLLLILLSSIAMVVLSVLLLVLSL